MSAWVAGNSNFTLTSAANTTWYHCPTERFDWKKLQTTVDFPSMPNSGPWFPYVDDPVACQPSLRMGESAGSILMLNQDRVRLDKVNGMNVSLFCLLGTKKSHWLASISVSILVDISALAPQPWPLRNSVSVLTGTSSLQITSATATFRAGRSRRILRLKLGYYILI